MAVIGKLNLATLPAGTTQDANGFINNFSHLGGWTKWEDGKLIFSTACNEDALEIFSYMGFDESSILQIHKDTQEDIGYLLGSSFKVAAVQAGMVVDKTLPRYSGHFQIVRQALGDKEWLYSNEEEIVNHDRIIGYFFEPEEDIKKRLITKVDLWSLFENIKTNQVFVELNGSVKNVEPSNYWRVFDNDSIDKVQCSVLGHDFTVGEYIQMLCENVTSEAKRKGIFRQIQLMTRQALKSIAAKHEYGEIAKNLEEFIDGDEERFYRVVSRSPEQAYKKDGPGIWHHEEFTTFIESLTMTDGEVWDVGYWSNDEKTEFSCIYLDCDDHTRYHSVRLTNHTEKGVVCKTFLRGLEVNGDSPLTVIHKVILNHLLEKGLVKMPA